MTDKFKNVTKEDDTLIFNEKKINLPYTILCIKPHVCVDNQQTQEIIDKIEEEGFEIRFVINRQLTEQECENMYYQHEGHEDYKKMIVYNSCGPSLVMLLSHKTEDPIEKLNNLCGDSDPEVAKTEQPDSFRAKYGEDSVKNAVYCSEDSFGANKDRDIFYFPIPQKVPEFVFDKNLISKEMLWKFLHPIHLEHSDVSFSF